MILLSPNQPGAAAPGRRRRELPLYPSPVPQFGSRRSLAEWQLGVGTWAGRSGRLAAVLLMGTGLFSSATIYMD